MGMDILGNVNEFITKRALDAYENDTDYGDVDYASISDMDAIRIACAISYGAGRASAECIEAIACNASLWLGISFPGMARNMYDGEHTYAEAILGIVKDAREARVI